MLADLKDFVDEARVGERFIFQNEEYVYIQQTNATYAGNIKCVLAIRVNDTIPGTVLLVPYEPSKE